MPPSLDCINEVKNWKKIMTTGTAPAGAMPPSLNCINAVKNWENNYNAESSSYDNYNYYKKGYSPTTYYGPNGGTKAQVISFDGAYAIMMHNSNGETTLYKLDPPAENTITRLLHQLAQLQNTVIPIDDNMLNQSLSDQENGGNAKIMKGNNGRYVVEIVLPDGLASLFTEDNVYTYNPANSPASVGSDGVSYKQPYTNLGEDAPPRQGVQPPTKTPF